MKPATRTVLIYSIIIFTAMACVLVIGRLQSQADTSAAQEPVSPPSFSAQSGFYQDEFDLSMKCEGGGTIYYTLDGSDPVKEGAPTETALRYDQPLHVEDASEHENVYSMNTDTSTGFYGDLIRRVTGFGHPEYEAPQEKIDKCTIVRAVAMSEDGRCSEEQFGSYFVDKSVDRYRPCSVISIMTDPVNLFDDETGIYVTGNRFKRYLARKENRWTKWDANYYMDGKESEREARFELFDTEGQQLTARRCGIRIHGNVTRAYNQKSLSVFFYDDAGNPLPMGADFFGTGFDPESLLLSNGGQNNSTKYNNVGVAQALGDGYMERHYKPTVLFLDGEYWGFYWTCERYDADWIAYYYGVDRDNLVAVKFNGGAIYAIRSEDPAIRKQQSSAYEETLQTLMELDLSLPDNYAKAGQLLDLDAMIDYYAIETYLGNADWPTRNKEFWRTWETVGSESSGSGASEGVAASSSSGGLGSSGASPGSGDTFSDGRWRPPLFDLDLALNLDFNGLEQVIAKDELFAALWENEDFRRQYEERVFYCADHVFPPKKMSKLIDSYCDTYGQALGMSWDRFCKNRKHYMDSLRSEMDERKEFFEKRRAVVETWFDGSPPAADDTNSKADDIDPETDDTNKGSEQL